METASDAMKQALDTLEEFKPVGRKCDQTLDAAEDVFLTQGYSGASVDDIVDKAGISKATLYKYFGDKEALFAAVIRRVCTAQRDKFHALTMNTSTQDGLIAGSQMVVAFLTSPLALNVFRTCLAEAKRFPQVGHTFHVSAGMTMEKQLTEFFDHAEQAGDLLIADKELAANQFWQLCQSIYFYELAFSVRTTVSQQEKNRIVKGTLEMFVATYGTEPFKQRMAEALKNLD